MNPMNSNNATELLRAAIVKLIEMILESEEWPVEAFEDKVYREARATALKAKSSEELLMILDSEFLFGDDNSEPSTTGAFVFEALTGAPTYNYITGVI